MATKVCKKCGVDFNVRQMLDGKWKVLQRRNYCLDCSPFGTRPGRKSNGSQHPDGQSTCCTCLIKQDNTQFYMSRRDGNGEKKMRYECKSCLKKYFTERYIQTKVDAINLFGDKCHDCGITYPRQVYDFHHVDESTKLYDWRHMRQIAKEKREAELKKCVMLCANCHRIRHADEEV